MTAGATRKSKAAKHYEKMLPRVLDLYQKDYNQTEIADILTREGFRTLHGNPIHQPCVHRCLRRITRAKQVTSKPPAGTPAQPAESRELTDDDRIMEMMRERRAADDQILKYLSQIQGIDEGKIIMDQPIPPPPVPDLSHIPPEDRMYWMM